MMQAVIVLLALSTGGHWFGGEPVTIDVLWQLQQHPAANLVWQIHYKDAVLGRGQVALPAAEDRPRMTITPPKVRQPIDVTLAYRVVAAGQEQQLVDEGQLAVRLYPPFMPGDPTSWRDVVLVSPDDHPLHQWLLAGGIDIRRDNVAALRLMTPRLVLVAVPAGSLSGFDLAGLASLAEAGATVVLLHAGGEGRPFDFELATRTGGHALSVKDDHPLLAGLDKATIDAWLGAGGEVVPVVRAPADAPVLDVISVAIEQGGRTPEAIDALLVVKAMGRGRLIVAQLPPQVWSGDPRPQRWLANLLDYANSPVAATPSWNDRQLKEEPRSEP